MARASIKSPIPRPLNPLVRLFSQPSDFSTGYSSHPTFLSNVEITGCGTDAVYRRKELWVESSRGPFCRQATIGRLPDDVLLEIFNFYVDECRYSVYHGDDGWHTLVHVCRRWRDVVLASPCRLCLQLLCTHNRSVKEMLDIWPELPIIISDRGWYGRPNTVENVISALELKDRVFKISFLSIPSSDLTRFAAAMQDPFPALTHGGIWLDDDDEMAPVISDSFLGGSAPRLQHLTLKRIPFPALPNLLLSATGLVTLELRRIPHSGYISPEAMVACLSALTRLELLSLGFRSPRSHPAKASRRRPPLTRIVLPALTDLCFKGVTEYLEDLVARIDAPLLDRFRITYFNQLVFDLLQLPKFLCRTETFTVLNRAEVAFNEHFTYVDFSSQTEKSLLALTIPCRGLDWQLSSLSQVCNSALLVLSAVEYFNLDDEISDASSRLIEADMETTQWSELLHPFTNVKDLHLSEDVLTCIAPVLQELIDERVTEVLPTLQNIFIHESGDESKPVPEAIWEFCIARKLSGFPVAIHRLGGDPKNRTWVVIESRTQ